MSGTLPQSQSFRHLLEREHMDTSVLKGVPLFKDLEPEDLEALGELMSETSLKRGDSLFREGDEGDRLYILTEAGVKLSHSSDDGRENLIAVLGAPVRSSVSYHCSILGLVPPRSPQLHPRSCSRCRTRT